MSASVLRTARLLRPPSAQWKRLIAGRTTAAAPSKSLQVILHFRQMARIGTVGGAVAYVAWLPQGALCMADARAGEDTAAPGKREADADEEDGAAAFPISEDALMSFLGPMGGQITFGTVTGFCSGYALKQVGRTAAYIVGIAFIFVQGLSYMGYINVKWAKVKDDLIKAVDPDGDGKLTVSDLRHYWRKLVNLLTFQLPSSAGFASGLVLGLRYG